MEKKKDSEMRLYKADLREALEKGYDDEKDEKKQAKTTLFLPLWLRQILADIKEEYDMPLYTIMSRTVRLGADIVQHEYKDRIKELKRLWKKIRWSDNIYLTSLPDHKFSVNSMVIVKKKFLTLPKWSHNFLGDMARGLNSDLSAMIRLAMYHALSRWDKLPHKCKKHIEKEIAKFEKQINDQLVILRLIAEDKGDKENEG